MGFLLRTVMRFLIYSFLRHHTDLTNATFWRPATKQRHDKDQRPWKWHWLAGYQRLLIRLAVLFTITIGTYAWFTERTEFLWTAGTATALFLGWAGTRIYLRIVNRRFRRAVADPVEAGVTTLFAQHGGRAA